MIQKYALVCFAFFAFIASGFGQVAQFNFPATNSLQVSLRDPNVTVSNVALSTGTIETNITTGTYFPNEPYIEEGGDWTATTQATAKNFYFDITAAAGYQFTITNISFRAYATAAGPSAFGFAVDNNNIYSVSAPNSALVYVNEPVSGQDNLTTARVKIQGWLNGSRTSSGAGVFRLDDIIITGVVTATSTDEVDFCNLQFPRNGTITLGDAYAVYGQVYEDGVTPGAGQGAGITAEVGYSTTNTNPNTWTNWIPATYNPACADCNGGQNDEYSANLGGAITTGGTYYYATRFSLNSGPFTYGGILDDGSNGNFWDGTTYLSGVLTVQSPPILAITGTPVNHGASCLGVATTSVTYTITNTGNLPANGVTVTSNNPEFVVSALSSTTIAANGGTATYVVTFTPGTAGARNATITVASTSAGSNSPVSNLTGTGNANVNATLNTNAATGLGVNGATLNANAVTFGVCPNTTAKGFVYSVNSVNNNPINGGTGVTTTTLTLGTQGNFNQPITGLAEGTTYAYQAYLYNATTDTYTYGGVQTFTTTIAAPNNVTATTACLVDNAGTVSWTAPATGATPTGYMVFAVAAATYGTGGFTTNNSDYPIVNSDFSAATTYGPLGRLLYRGNATSVDITGLTENTAYSFRVVSYREGGNIRGFANATTAGSRFENVIAQDDVRNLAGTPNTNQVNLTWTVPTPIACWDQLIIVANEGNVVFTPTGTYTNTVGGSVYLGANQIVYATGSNVSTRTISGLSNDIEYCFTVYVRRGTEWSDGVEVCVTPTLTYCESFGDGADGFLTLIRGVQFNTINNPSANTDNAYSDFTAISTTVNIGESYDLSVNVNTDGNFTTTTRAWIDWNRDGVFTQASEGYELGTALNVVDGPTSTSPLSIQVPSNAVTGATRMRVSTIFDTTSSTPCQENFDGEVEDYTINIVRSADAEINIKGNNITIPNGFDEPYGLNNTLYAETDIGVPTAFKEFVIENLGLQPLDLDGLPDLIQLAGNHPGDFEVTQQATTPVAIAGGTTTFRIIFRPTATGDRTALVTIPNSDSNEDPYTFLIRGTGVCTSNPVVTAYPSSGPANTVVTFTSTVNDLTGATVTYNGVSIPLISSSATTVEAAVPLDAANGNMELQLANGCTFTHPFDVIDFAVNDCDAGGNTFGSELTIYEIYDEKGLSGGFVTIYNGTNATVNLAGYNIQRAGTYGGSYITYANLSGNIASGSLAIISVSGSYCPFTTTGNGSFGISGFNENDGFRLRNGTTIIDDVRTPNYVGYYMKRKTDFVLTPNTTYDSDEWIIQPVNSVSGNSECLPGFGIPPVRRAPPIVDAITSIEASCDSYEINVTAAEGTPSGSGLTYQWYSNTPEQLGWTLLTDSATYSGTTTETLTISNVYDVDNYQYYVRVMEGGVDCYAASDAVQISLNVKRWIGSAPNDWTDDANWAPAGIPTVNDVVVIPSGNPIIIGTPPFPPTVPLYAKSLIVLSGASLEIPVGKNLIVENCIVNYGTIDLKNNANLVQVNETNENTGNGNFFMERIVSDVQSLNYIYWSSPIAGFNISGIPGSNTHRYYWDPTEFNANGSQGDWIAATGDDMDRGVGYIIRVAGATPNLDVTLGGNGLGTPHNGIFTTPISKGSHVFADPADNVNNYYNLIGNPYPSAISADTFISVNASQLMDDVPAEPSVLGTIYLWRHQATPDGAIDNPFYEDFAINYDGSNYVAYNATGATPANGFDGNIASGQAFFVLMDETTTTNTVTFSNAMRYGDPVTDAYDNGQFLRTVSSEQSANTIERHRIWLDLIAPNNSSVSTLVGYVTGATNAKDRLFDGYETNATGLGFYSMVGYDRMGIQGRALPFIDTDTVPLGVNLIQTGTHTIAINQVDGLFEAGQAIFLEDTYTNTIHNMRATPYTFHSVGGKFNDRFILRYTNSTLSIPDVTVDTGLTIIELSNGNVKFTVGNNLSIQSVEIFDMLGRQLYNLPGSNPIEVYNLANLSQAAYVAKVTLSNGQTVTKRAVKRQ